EYRGHASQALAQLFARLGGGGIGTGRVGQYIDQGAPIALDAVHQQAAVGPRHRINRQQRRMRKALVQVFHHDVGLVEHQITIKQSGNCIVGVDLGQLLGVVIRLHVHDVDGDTLFRQDNTHPVAILIARIGKESHRGTLVGTDTHISTPILQKHTARPSSIPAACSKTASIPHQPGTPAAWTDAPAGQDLHKRKRAPEGAFSWSEDRQALLDVFPVLTLEQVGEDEEEGQIQQYVDTDAMAGFLDRVSRVAEEGNQVAHGGVVLVGGLGTGTLDHSQHVALLGQHGLAGQGVAHDLAVFLHRYRSAALDLLALQLGQHVRHAHVLEHGVVPAEGTGTVLIERTQVGVQPVLAAYAGNHGQIRRRSPEPDLGVLGTHADLHVDAVQRVGEDQVLHHQLFRDTQVGSHTLIALVLSRVAAHAIVDEGTCAVLQSSLVGQVDVGLVQVHTRPGRQSEARQQREHQCNQL